MKIRKGKPRARENQVRENQARENQARPKPAAAEPHEKKEKTTMAKRFEVGQKVKFRPFGNKALELTGTVKSVSDDGNVLNVTAHPDGKVIEVEHDFDARSEDTTETD